jgi:UDP-glucuronate decarboxylase
MPDISRSSAALGWTPQVALRDGLARTIAYFEDLLKNFPGQLSASR